MSRYIDYDAIDYRNDKMHDKSSDFIDGVIYMAQRIEDAPSIDIVRCKECMFADVDAEAEMARCSLVSFPIWHRCDYFCSDGERRE